MTPAERAAKIAELRAEADRLERGWPECVKRGMLFRHSHGRTYFIHRTDGSQPEMIGILGVNIDVPTYGSLKWLQENSNDFVYLGCIRDQLTIKTPDEEPTGADLVGKYCEYSNDGINWGMFGASECTGYNPSNPSYRYFTHDNTSCAKMARLYREDRP